MSIFIKYKHNMRFVIVNLLIFVTSSSFAQQSDYKSAYLEKWQNSRDYLIAFAEAMPEESFDFKPVAAEMSFGEQLKHINANMEWLATAYLGKEENKAFAEAKNKAEIIAQIKNSFDQIAKTVKNLPENSLRETVKFFAGPKTKLQILNLMQDHVTHHRGQLVVYLNLKGIKPPGYVGW